MPALIRIERPAAGEFNPYFSRYIDRVTGEDALDALASQIRETVALLEGLSESKALHRYAPGKWSVKETITHLTDSERVFAYRALTCARRDPTPMPGYDESVWGPEMRSDARPLADLLAELKAVRASSLALFGGLEPEALTFVGTANASPMTARAGAWIIAGHELHHRNILQERYGLGA